MKIWIKIEGDAGPSREFHWEGDNPKSWLNGILLIRGKWVEWKILDGEKVHKGFGKTEFLQNLNLG